MVSLEFADAGVPGGAVDLLDTLLGRGQHLLDIAADPKNGILILPSSLPSTST